MQIINSKENIDTDLFKSYGINLQDDAILIENDNYFKIFLILNTTILIILSVLILIIFIKYNHSKDKN